MLTDPEIKELCDAAKSAAAEAYAPYSKFRVGAAVLGQSVHRGANVENASFGLSFCAERSALVGARMAGDRNLRAIAIAFPDAGPDATPEELVPCGSCRQWLAELAPDAEIHICNTGDRWSLQDLFPHPFRLSQ